jgi:transposase InsO family protein
MREYGVPARIRTDNSAPFAGTGLLGLSKLSLGWMKLGLMHERIQAGIPQENGRHERMHRTLKEDTTKPPAASLRAQQSLFDRYVFNNERSHEALNSERLTGALLDRLTHHVHILEMNGDSYRLKQSRRKRAPSAER